MLEGRTADCLAIANTAILMRLIDEFIERGLISKQGANALLADAADTLANCPNAEHSNFEEAIRIIRKELIRRADADPLS
ncbi:MAG: hypothetical protein JJE37_05350 [Methyloceanibacter sp.]|nr:hypothetical protein [Methyloceanibacter sp.]